MVLEPLKQRQDMVHEILHIMWYLVIGIGCRNVLKATIDVPQAGEMNVFCTLLDHLDENWRMKQINAIIQSTGVPHILAGGLNSLDESDYSQERWTDIVKVNPFCTFSNKFLIILTMYQCCLMLQYYEDMGKPTPKVEVMKYLKSKEYTDAKDYAGECESVVMIAKGQSKSYYISLKLTNA